MPEMWDLEGKTALVTGGARRLGRAVSWALAEHGANVAVHYRTSANEAEALAAAIRQLNVMSWAIAADLGDCAQAAALFSRVVDLAGPVDVLVNNAAIFLESRLCEVSAEDIQSNLNVNALAPLLISREFAAQGREGAIVNFLDTRMVDYDHNHVAYHLGKRTLFALTRMMALEFAPKLRVNAVAPGLILPPEGENESYLEDLASTNPLNRYGAADDVVEAVLFLLRSRFITGQVIFVDGGRHIKGSVYG